MQNISDGLDELMINILVTQMINPDNKDFYLPTLTVGKAQEMFVEMQSAGITAIDIFWAAFKKASKYFLQNKLAKNKKI